MQTDVIQADYAQLQAITERFSRAAEASALIAQRVRADFAPLVDGGWQGRGSASFRAEMDGELLPALERLVDALRTAQSVTTDIEMLLRHAEEQAARPFRGGEAPAAVVDNGAAAETQSWWDRWGGWVHNTLDVLGFIPGAGALADGANALIYLAEGRTVEATVSAVAMIPLFGDGMKLGKMGIRGGKELLEGVAETGAKRLTHEGVEELVEEGGERLAREGAPVLRREVVEEGAERPFLRFGELEPSTRYERNGYEYITDAESRVERFSGTLRLEKAPRTSHQTEIGHMGIDGDQGGHLIGSRFGGTPEGVNIVPQNGYLNQHGKWRKLEDSWAAALEEGKTVKVDVRLRHPPDGIGRPAIFEVRHTINGVPQKVQIIHNRPGG
jgi:WXG100 family type VII secretion target